jgi:hypothetical protein
MKLSSELKLPLTGLTGFETPLGEEERAIQETVHRFARDVLRPLGEELDKMSAEQVVAPGSPYYSVFAEAAKLGLDPELLAQLPVETARKWAGAMPGWAYRSRRPRFQWRWRRPLAIRNSSICARAESAAG